MVSVGTGVYPLVLSPAGNRLSFSSFGGLHVCLHEHSPVTADGVQLSVAEPTLLNFSRGFWFCEIMKTLAP